MTTERAVRRIVMIMQYEPSWFAEVMSATGLFLWAVFAFMTDDYDVTGPACILPALCILFGPIRTAALFSLQAQWRVLAAIVAGAFWISIWSSLFTRSGFLPVHGIVIGVLLGDALTIGKFSLVAWLRGGR
jgi:hypothetical protein